MHGVRMKIKTEGGKQNWILQSKWQPNLLNFILVNINRVRDARVRETAKKVRQKVMIKEEKRQPKMV